MFPLYVRVTEVTGGETKREILSGSKTAVFLRRTPRNLTSDLCRVCRAQCFPSMYV